MDIPEELQFRDVRKQAPVIISKESRQVLPQNGTNFEQGDSGSTQIVFRLPNEENSSTDLSTMWITADLNVQDLPQADSAGTTAFFGSECTWCNDVEVKSVVATANTQATQPMLLSCDSIESAIRQVHILVNGSELERHDYYNYVESMLNMHTNNANFSDSIGAGCMLMNLNPYEKNKLFIGNGAAARTTSNTIQVSFPLRWCGVANLRSLVPTYLLGGGQSAIEIRLFLENANNFLCAGHLVYPAAGGTNTKTAPREFVPTITGLKYRLSNVRMNYDVVQTSDAYTSSLRSYLASNQLTLPIDTYYSTQFDLPSSSGWSNFTISTQMSDISAVFIGFVKGHEQSNYAFCSTDRFYKPPGLEEARLQINGKPYPNVNIRLSNNWAAPEAEAYQYLMKALRQNCSLEVIGNSNQYRNIGKNIIYANAVGTTNTRQKQLSITPSGLYYGINKVAPSQTASPYLPQIITGITTNTGLPTVANAATQLLAGGVFDDTAHFWDSPSNFILGFDISKSNYNNEYELSGQDLTKSSGLIQVNLKFAQNPSDYRAIVVVKHKRILDIGLDSSQVIY